MDSNDNADQFNLNYYDYGMKGIKTSVKAPNMNALAERFVGSVRRKALDFYLLMSENRYPKYCKSILKITIQNARTKA